MAEGEKSRLIIVDLSNFIFRAFYAIRPLHAPDGTPVNALYGVFSMILKLIDDYSPTHLLIARDGPEASFRLELDPGYKADRSAPPDDLVVQFSLIDQLVEFLEIPSLRISGQEADDIIGSVVKQYAQKFDSVLIASGDKDLMQFVEGPVELLDTMKNKRYLRNDVFEKMGVYPEQICDFLSLVGDSSDNIPGVKGVGKKGASELLAEYGSLNQVYQSLEKITKKRLKQNLEEGKDKAFLSYKLVTISGDLELKINQNSLEYQLSPSPKLREFLEKFGLQSFVTRLYSESAEVLKERPAPDFTSENFFELASFKKSKDPEIFLDFIEDLGDSETSFVPIGLAWKTSFIFIKDGPQLSQVLEDLEKCRPSKFIGNGIKEFLKLQLRINQRFILAQYFDLSQAEFVLRPDMKNSVAAVVERRLGITVQDLEKKSTQKSLLSNDTELESILIDRISTFEQIYQQQKLELDEKNLSAIFYDFDSPLCPVLAKMEFQGICFDNDYFEQLELSFTQQIDEIRKKVEDAGGGDVNLNSPKQLSELLFEKLGLPVLKKTKTGASTDVEVLTKLAQMNLHPIPELILSYRELDKLNGTYVKSIPKLVSPETKRLHTHFHQNVAATGRLSSDRPNLQNIPIRTENGRRLRRGFVAPREYVLVGGDYSQIELRILAHCSGDPVMVEAFQKNNDIHQQTAAEIFEVSLDKVSSQQRSSAKAINFGLMYGQSSFGLSQSLGISMAEARDYITHYFTRFGQVKAFLDELRERCEKTGYAETLFGRKRPLPDINGKNRAMKANAERMAINSPIQGSAADLIKKAMLNIDSELSKKTWKAKMLLQVHDELIFECPQEEASELKELVKKEMESAAEFKVPLKVDMKVATNWYDLK